MGRSTWRDGARARQASRRLGALRFTAQAQARTRPRSRGASSLDYRARRLEAVAWAVGRRDSCRLAAPQIEQPRETVSSSSSSELRLFLLSSPDTMTERARAKIDRESRDPVCRVCMGMGGGRAD